MSTIENVREYLQALGLADGILEFPVSSATVELAAQAAGVIPARIAKTLSFALPDGPILVVAAGDAKVDVIVYDPANTTEPTLVLVDEVPAIAMDTDSTTIDWTSFVAEAKDASGLDLKANITVDDSTLDTSMPDVYTVTLTVVDYAGNTASVDVEVEVVVE